MTKYSKYAFKNLKSTLLCAPVVGFLLYLLIAQFSTVSAQSTAPLVVAPARQSLLVDPGKSVGFAIRFYNTSSEPITGSFKAIDFIVEDNQGTPKFIEDSTLLSNRYAAASWISLNTERGTVSGDGMVTINGTAKAPSDARPGGRYFAIFFEPDTEVPGATGAKQQEAASVTLRIAGLVYLRVSGPISEGANIVRFGAPSFSEFGPVAITTEIKNNGDYHIAPAGTITIKDMFGKIVSKVNLSEANIFPDSSRVTVTKVGEKWMVGRFTASLDAKYGDTGKMLAASLVFWVFPWKLAILIVLIVAIVILAVYLIVNKFVRKEKKLEAELKQEKTELEKLKAKLEDQIKSAIPHSTDSPTKDIK